MTFHLNVHFCKNNQSSGLEIGSREENNEIILKLFNNQSDNPKLGFHAIYSKGRLIPGSVLEPARKYPAPHTQLVRLFADAYCAPE